MAASLITCSQTRNFINGYILFTNNRCWRKPVRKPSLDIARSILLDSLKRPCHIMNDTSIQTPEFNEPSRGETNVVICICSEIVDNRNGKDIGTIWSQGVMLAKDWEKKCFITGNQDMCVAYGVAVITTISVRGRSWWSDLLIRVGRCAPFKYFGFCELSKRGKKGFLTHGKLVNIIFGTEATTSSSLCRLPQAPTLGMKWNTGNNYCQRQEAIHAC